MKRKNFLVFTFMAIFYSKLTPTVTSHRWTTDLHFRERKLTRLEPNMSSIMLI